MVSGASIQDNKFAVIRGLNDRYNAAFLNGAPLPSSESDRKAFSFDIFPSNMLENLIISKSATPDMPAEFAGGIIQINTKGIPEKKFYSVAVGGGYNTLTTFKDQVTYAGGKTDWIGLDNGSRALSSEVPAYGTYPNSISEQASLAQKFTTPWGFSNKTFSPNYNFQLSTGLNFKLFNKEFGLVSALTYNRSFSYTETIRRGYTNGSSTDPSAVSQLDYDYLDKNYSELVLAGGLFNLAMKLNKNNNLSFKNIYSINSDDKVVNRTGEINPLESNPSLLRSNARWFTSNAIYSGQLAGEHLLKGIPIRINWISSYSHVKRVIPSLNRSIYTRFRTVLDPSDPNPLDTQFVANIAFSSVGPAYGGGMFFSENIENSINNKFDISYDVNLFGKLKTEFKIGAYSQMRDRDFQARQLGYTKYGVVGGNVTFKESLLYLPEDQIFAPENMGLLEAPSSANGNMGVGGFKLTDGTKFSDAYTANSNLTAGYLQIDNRFANNLRLIYGVRVENFEQKLDARKDNNSPLSIKTVKLDVLPSLNAVYALTKTKNLRLSYSQTLNRPEYRELAPFAFYDFTTNFVVSGNDSLVRAKIQNLDLRFEAFPGRGQLMSATIFYKNFTNSIEQVSRPDVTNEISFKNAPTASNYGLELEARTLISNLIHSDTSSFFDKMTVYSNLAIIRSTVDVSKVLGSAESSRPLQGQSPYVFNAGLQYNDKRFNWSAALNVNRVGQRIAIVGNVNEPDLWENARTFIDLQLTKSFWKNRAEFKVNIQNILAQNQIFYQNSGVERSVKGANGFFNTVFVGDKNNSNGYNEDTDDVVWNTRFGRTISATLSIKF